MGKGRMLLISGMITGFLVIIGSIALFVGSEESPLEHIIHKEEKKSVPKVSAEKTAEEPIDNVENEISDSEKGITDEIGVHHILFESGEVEYTASSGPMKLIVTQVRLEELIPATEHIRNSVSGNDRSTLAFMQLQVQNNGKETVYFRIDDAKIQADTNETSLFHPAFSTQFGSVFSPYEKKEGTVVVDFASEILDVAVIEIKVASPFDKSYDPIGKAVTLKVPMY